MTQPAVLRLRGPDALIHVQIVWPLAPAPGSVLLRFGGGSVSRPPNVLTLTAFCDTAADAIRTAAWAGDHSEELGAPASRFVVAGHGAAGRLAAAVALYARDQRWPRIVRQILVTPALLPSSDTGPYGSPLRAVNLAGLAPATVVTTPDGDGRRYAARLRLAGVAVDELSALVPPS